MELKIDILTSLWRQSLSMQKHTDKRLFILALATGIYICHQRKVNRRLANELKELKDQKGE